MIDFTPSDCEYKPYFKGARPELDAGLVASVDPDIIANQGAVCVRSTLENFRQLTDENLAIVFPELTDISTFANEAPWPSKTYDVIDGNEYDSDLVQGLHKDNDEASDNPVAFFLKGNRNFATIIVADTFYGSDEFRQLVDDFDYKQDLHKELVRRNLAFTINQKSGLTFLSDKNTRHARTILGTKKVNAKAEPWLHCYDLPWSGEMVDYDNFFDRTKKPH